MKDTITCKITRHIGVISESSKGWRLELNMVSWNGAEPKLDIHDWSPDHERCNNRGTFTREEASTLIKLLKKSVGKMSIGEKGKKSKQSVNAAKEKKHPPKPCRLCDFLAQAGRENPQRSSDRRGDIKFVVFEQCKDEPDKFTSS